ncbi:hypothetical protein SCG7109_CB_00030 [Chlamydiales bacterium SCGC AG-110-M15]|nr:hypothetical protein SCG7109_CB_00030 [Chlamydiales bacterium SCGC AG-110-M15]
MKIAKYAPVKDINLVDQAKKLIDSHGKEIAIAAAAIAALAILALIGTKIYDVAKNANQRRIEKNAKIRENELNTVVINYKDVGYTQKNVDDMRNKLVSKAMTEQQQTEKGLTPGAGNPTKEQYESMTSKEILEAHLKAKKHKNKKNKKNKKNRRKKTHNADTVNSSKKAKSSKRKRNPQPDAV